MRFAMSSGQLRRTNAPGSADGSSDDAVVFFRACERPTVPLPAQAQTCRDTLGDCSMAAFEEEHEREGDLVAAVVAALDGDPADACIDAAIGVLRARGLAEADG